MNPPKLNIDAPLMGELRMMNCEFRIFSQLHHSQFG